MRGIRSFFKVGCVLVAFLVALGFALLFTDRGNGSENSKILEESAAKPKTEQPTKQQQVVARETDQVAERGSGNEIWSTGKPSPTPPVVRGPNNERQFEVPTTRELNGFDEGLAPTLMAMLPADGREKLLPNEIDDHTLSARRMVLNTRALDRIIDGTANRLLVPTPDRKENLVLKIEKIRTRSKQTHSLIGKVAGEALSEVNIVYHDGIVHGTVVRYDADEHFEYRILPDGHMMVREIDTASMTDVCGIPNDDVEHSCDETCKHEAADVEIVHADSPGSESGPTVEADTTGWTTVDVVVGYGAEARVAQGGVTQMEAHIIAAVDRMTDAFANSAVNDTELMLLGTVEDPDYVFPGSSASTMGTADELGNLNDGTDGILDTVTDYSATLGADLTSFIVKNGQNGTAGIAYRPGRSSIVSRTSMSSFSLTFSHELGHNFGAKHSLGDSGSDNNLTTPRYGFRFEGSSGSRYRTIMAYSNVDWSTTRIPHFANPSVSFDGTPTGVNDGVDLTGNSLVDPVYATLGYDGSNPDLGARNAQMFLVQAGSNGVVYASNRSIRTGLGVTSPAQSVQWAAGTSQTVSFTGGDMHYTATIDLYKGGVYQETLTDGINATKRNFTWNIPLAQDGGNDYQIRVTLTHLHTLATSFVESDFFIIQGVNDIILEAPVGGETWTRNTRQTITWSSSYGGNVKIQLKKGSAAPVTIIESTPDDGFYEWTIPSDQILDSDYRMIVTSDVSPFDASQSAADFTIAAPSNNLLVTNLDADPGFTTSGEFEYGAPGSGNGASAPYTGTNMYDTDLDATSFGTSTLTTYAIDCSNHTSIHMDFWAYIMVWTDYLVRFEISTDNSNWIELETVGDGVILNQSWTNYSYDITAIAAGEPTVYIRWTMTGSGSQYSGGGLSIDDILITGDFIPADGFSVLRPNAGESIDTNTLNQISWLSSLGGHVRIELLKNGSVVTTIADNSPNDGTFNWLVPDTLTPDSDYKIRITSVENTSKQGESTSNFTVAVPTNTVFSSNLDTDPGFTTTGEFEYGAPSGNNQPAAAHTGTNLYDTDLDATAFSISSLTTMAIDCSRRENVTLQFWSHIYVTSNYEIVFEVSNDQSTWHNLFTASGSITNNSWVERNYDISQWADGESTVYIRWAMNNPTSTYSQWGGGGLAIDDVTISGDFVADPPTYDTWAEGPASDADTSGDGIKNGIAWVLGAPGPSETATSIQPTIDNLSDANYMIFTYRRADVARDDPNTTIAVEYGSDLVGWATATRDNDNVIITEDNDFFGNGIDRVQVKLKNTLAIEDRLFSRLKVQVTE